MAHESLSIPQESPADVDSYRLIQTLTPDRTFLCSDASANIVVLVRLEDDCLHRGMLHPSIRDRLARVRELPHPRVATLRGVERWNGIACLVWIYLDGENWEDHLRQHPGQFPALASSLVATVGALHDLGIVHGDLSGRNIIVRPDGQPWLTQVSPYLYTDPNADITAIIDLLRGAGAHLDHPAPMTPVLRYTEEPGGAVKNPALRSESEPALASSSRCDSLRVRLHRLLDQFETQRFSLKELSQSLLELARDEAVEKASETSARESSYRRRSLLGALLIAMAAIAIGIGFHRSFSKPSAPGPATFPSLKPEARS